MNVAPAIRRALREESLGAGPRTRQLKNAAEAPESGQGDAATRRSLSGVGPWPAADGPPARRFSGPRRGIRSEMPVGLIRASMRSARSAALARRGQACNSPPSAATTDAEADRAARRSPD